MGLMLYTRVTATIFDPSSLQKNDERPRYNGSATLNIRDQIHISLGIEV